MNDTEQLSQELKGEAIALNLCDQWTKEWSEGLTKQELVDRFIKGYDFCIKHNWPDNKFIKDNFDAQLLHANNIYIDEEFAISNTCGFVIAQGKCKGRIIETGLSSTTIHARHDSELVVGTGDVARVFIHLYDNAKLVVRQSMFSKVFVYKHSNSCNVISKGNVVIREK